MKIENLNNKIFALSDGFYSENEIKYLVSDLNFKNIEVEIKPNVPRAEITLTALMMFIGGSVALGFCQKAGEDLWDCFSKKICESLRKKRELLTLLGTENKIKQVKLECQLIIGSAKFKIILTENMSSEDRKNIHPSLKRIIKM